MSSDSAALRSTSWSLTQLALFRYVFRAMRNSIAAPVPRDFVRLDFAHFLEPRVVFVREEVGARGEVPRATLGVLLQGRGGRVLQRWSVVVSRLRG
jgi:hypothetical protein